MGLSAMVSARDDRPDSESFHVDANDASDVWSVCSWFMGCDRDWEDDWWSLDDCCEVSLYGGGGGGGGACGNACGGACGMVCGCGAGRDLDVWGFRVCVLTAGGLFARSHAILLARSMTCCSSLIQEVMSLICVCMYCVRVWGRVRVGGGLLRGVVHGHVDRGRYQKGMILVKIDWVNC